jgi:type II secretory pathway pseudopilin PulG
MSMTKLKICIAGGIALAVAIPLVLQHRQKSRLREEVESLRQQAEQTETLRAENQRLANRIARATPPPSAPTNEQYRELLKLRGEVGRLRQDMIESTTTVAKATGPSALSGMTSNPEIQKLIRGQQKVGMGILYKDFAKRLNLAPEMSEKLQEALADNVMENVDHITAILRDGKTPEQMNQMFAQQEAALNEKVQTLLGPEGLAKYQDYTKNLMSHMTAEQFTGTLPGEKAAKEEKSKQLFQVIQAETQQSLASAGLPPDFQTIPILNFRNIASEEEGERNLKLLEGIYERSTAKAASFLSPEELQKFAEFQKTAINGNRAALIMNRKMMAPGSK